MVPTEVSAVARGDVTKTLNDGAVTKFVNAYLGMLSERENYTGPTDKAALLDRFTQEAGIELDGASTAVGYLKYPQEGMATPDGGPYAALWFEADWSEGDVVDALESGNLAFSEGSYGGQPLYEPDQEYQTQWLGITGEGTYVVGTEAAAKETIDVANGDAESFEGDLKEAYSDTRSAPFRFATSVPEGQIPEGSR